jgi:hypothetical protein
MCIAIGQDRGARTLTPDELRKCWKANPDGGGFAYINDSGTIVIKRSMDMEKWAWEYAKAHKRYGKDSPFLLHARIATHGSICIANTHPFRVSVAKGEQVFAHNGILPVQTNSDDDMSDTRVFGDLYLNVLPDTWYDNPAIVDLVEDYTQGSKLVVLTTHPNAKHNLYIMNEEDGNYSEDGKTWFSNYSWKYTSGGMGWDNWDEWATDDFDYTKYIGIQEKPRGSSGEVYDSFFPGQSLHVALDVDDYTFTQFTDAATHSGFCPACFMRPCQCHWMCYTCMRHFDECKCSMEKQEVPHLTRQKELEQTFVPSGMPKRKKGKVINGNFGKDCDGSYNCGHADKTACVCFEINLQDGTIAQDNVRSIHDVPLSEDVGI